MITAILALVLLPACQAGQEVEAWPAGEALYRFEEPDEVFELVGELEEISGLAVLPDGRLGAVQDEDGVLFILDPATGMIVDERPFGETGDYEAVALEGDRLLILESDGTMHRFTSWEAPELQGEEVVLDLPGGCDAEGLRYDEREDRLLVSCKEKGGQGLGRLKAIYAFTPDGRRLSSEPAIALDPRSFSESVDDHPVNEAVRSAVSERIDLSGFKPSDLAIHPVTGDLYVLSSVRAAVVAVGRGGDVVGVWKLPDELLDQPEGLDFLPNGDLFLSSEAGNRKRGVLLRYRFLGSQGASSE